MSCGSEPTLTKVPSEFTEKGIEKMLKDFSFARDDTVKIKEVKIYNSPQIVIQYH